MAVLKLVQCSQSGTPLAETKNVGSALRSRKQNPNSVLMVSIHCLAESASVSLPIPAVRDDRTCNVCTSEWLVIASFKNKEEECSQCGQNVQF